MAKTEKENILTAIYYLSGDVALAQNNTHQALFFITKANAQRPGRKATLTCTKAITDWQNCTRKPADWTLPFILPS